MFYIVIKHSGHLRTLEKWRKHLPVAGVFYISLVFSNDHCVLSQCNIRLRLLYLLNIYVWIYENKAKRLISRTKQAFFPRQRLSPEATI